MGGQQAADAPADDHSMMMSAGAHTADSFFVRE